MILDKMGQRWQYPQYFSLLAPFGHDCLLVAALLGLAEATKGWNALYFKHYLCQSFPH